MFRSEHILKGLGNQYCRGTKIKFSALLYPLISSYIAFFCIISELFHLSTSCSLLYFHIHSLSAGVVNGVVWHNHSN